MSNHSESKLLQQKYIGEDLAQDNDNVKRAIMAKVMYISPGKQEAIYRGKPS